MSLVEKARERLEEVRAKGPMATLEEKFPKIKEVRGSSGSSSSGGLLNSEGGILSDIREKGVIGVLEEKFPRVKEIREKGILARGASPKGEVAGEVEGEGMAQLRVKKGIHGDAI